MAVPASSARRQAQTQARTTLPPPPPSTASSALDRAMLYMPYVVYPQTSYLMQNGHYMGNLMNGYFYNPMFSSAGFSSNLNFGRNNNQPNNNNNNNNSINYFSTTFGDYSNNHFNMNVNVISPPAAQVFSFFY